MANKRKTKEQLSLEADELRHKTDTSARTPVPDQTDMTGGLNADESVLRVIFESSPDIICLKDGSRRWLELNRAAIELFSLTNIDYSGKTSSELAAIAHPVYRDAFLLCEASDEEAWRAGKASRFEEVIFKPDGSTFIFDVLKIPLFNGDGSRNRLFVIGRDITGHKNVQEKLRQTQETMLSLINSISESIYVQDERGVFLAVNDAAVKTYQMPREEILGKTPDFLSADGMNDIEAVAAMHKKAFDGESQVFEFWGKKADGSVFLKEVRLSPGVYFGKKVVIAVAGDITRKKMTEKALQESEQNYHNLYTVLRLMADTMPDMIWAKDLDKKYIFANKALCDILLNAKDTDEPKGKTDLFFAERERNSHPEDPDWHTFGELCMDSDTQTMEERRQLQFLEYGNVKGEFLYLDVHKAPLFNDNGELIGVVGSARDITEKKKAEDALKQSEEIHRKLIMTVPDIIIRTDLTGKIIFVNDPPLRKYSFLSKETLLGKNILSFVDAEDRERAIENTKLMFERSLGPREYRLNLSPGTPLVCEVNGDVILDSNGQPNGIVYVIRDITERKVAEDELIKHSKLRELLIEFSTSFINLPLKDVESEIGSSLERIGLFVGADRSYIFDFDEKNKRCSNTYEWCREGIECQKDLLQNIPLGDDMYESFIKGEAFNTPDVGAMPQGYTKSVLQSQDIVSCFIIPMMMEGRFVGFVGFDYVRTHHFSSELEQQLLFIYANMLVNLWSRRSTENELVAAKVKAEENDRLKTAFLHNISHEIRTPMNAIIGFSELLHDSVSATEQSRRYTQKISQASNQLLSIMTDIIDIATIETGQVRVYKRRANLFNLCNEVYSELSLKAGEKNLRFNFSAKAPHDRLMIESDDIKLKRIIKHLVDNAIKFTDSGYVNLGFDAENNSVRVFVEDTGIGIDDEMREVIFTPFRQADLKTMGQYGGSGLGLSIVKAYVELLGGTLTLSSQPGKGSTFSFMLPAGKDPEEIKLTEVETGKPDTQTLKNKIVLIVDDEASNSLLLEEYFKGLELQIIKAVNGKQAVELCTSVKGISLVLMDLKMPVMDGFEATRRIRAIRRDLPIIAQTAYSAVEDRAKALNAGCTDFISKPIIKAEFQKKILGYLA
ncbi:MAG: PAS domain S-box protein [Ignavibacteriaceae bacterium]|nr:PAS domain S-box protein [Ignavibacteriaceae bacterium]